MRVSQLYKYITLGAIGTVLVFFSLHFKTNPVFGSLALAAYLFGHGYLVGRYALRNSYIVHQILIGALITMSLQILLLSALYWFFSYSVTFVSLSLVTVSALILLFSHFFKKHVENTEITLCTKSHTSLLELIPIVLSIALSLGVISGFWQKRYTDTLVSPWTITGPLWFVWYGGLSAITLYALRKQERPRLQTLAAMLFTFATLSIAALVFAYGFGFDPIIHQASELWIRDYGTLLPKQPYYIGQYMLVLTIHAITALSIPTIDNALMPALAALVLPIIFSIKPNRFVRVLPAVLIFVIPFTWFIQTTPNNLALLFALVSSMWLFAYTETRDRRALIFGSVFPAMAIAAHPLIGVPAFLIYTFLSIRILSNNSALRRATLILGFIAVTAVTPALFILQGMRQGGSLTIDSPLSNLSRLADLFSIPHWYLFEGAPMAWQLLYIYRSGFLYIIVTLICVYSVLWLRKRHRETSSFALFAAALTLSGGLVGTMFRFTDIVSYEQTVFAKRLITLAFFFLIPFAIDALTRISSRTERLRPAFQLIGIGAVSILMTVGWYFTYPTRDPVSKHSGFSIRSADIEAVRFIHERNGTEPNYIVLTNQVVSSAAMREFSFLQYHNTPKGPQYFYSIPTGGPMYEFFAKMIYQEPKRLWMEEAMAFTNVPRAYFIHTSYWYPAAKIRDEAKKEADAWWEFGDGRVWVYEYISPSSTLLIDR